MRRLPLSGVTVVTVEQAVAAPYATRQLADLGARVIKVERPGEGDFARRYDTTVHGTSSYFVWINRSKESLTLDLKDPRGRDILHELLADADVFVQNLAPGAAGPARAGRGRPGPPPSAPRPLHDLGLGHDRPVGRPQGVRPAGAVPDGSGVAHRHPGETARTGISVADIAAGMYAYSGVLTALYTRATTGEVHPVEVSLFEALAEWMGQPAYYTRYGGAQPPRLGTQHATIAPYGTFRAADGREVLFSIQNEREWAALCREFLGRPELTDDPRFATSSDRVAHRDELNAIVADRCARDDAEELLKNLEGIGIACAGVNDVAAFLDHPVLAERGRWREIGVPGGTAEALLPPADLAGLPARMDPVPAVGEHTETILRDLGRTPEDIEALRADAVI